jgi:hypothetical protein
MFIHAIEGHHRYFRKASSPATAFQSFDPVMDLPKGQAFIERGMGIRLADEDEVEAVF